MSPCLYRTPSQLCSIRPPSSRSSLTSTDPVDIVNGGRRSLPTDRNDAAILLLWSACRQLQCVDEECGRRRKLSTDRSTRPPPPAPVPEVPVSTPPPPLCPLPPYSDVTTGVRQVVDVGGPPTEVVEIVGPRAVLR